MELRDIRYFHAVVKNGNITKAAQEIHIAQPTISRQIQLLEHELGVTLFTRGKHSIELTPAGTIFFNRTNNVIFDIEQATKEMKYLKDDIIGTLSIVTSDSMSSTIVAPIIKNFYQKYPLVTFQLRQAQASKMSEFLRKNEADIAFMTTPFNEDQFDFIPIMQTHLGVVMRKDSPIGKNENHIKLVELMKIPLILPNRYRFPFFEAFWDKGYGDPKVLSDSYSVSNDLIWVKNGVGVSVSPSLCQKMPAYDTEELLFKKLIDPSFEYTNVLAWNKRSTPHKIAQCFIDFCNEYVKEHFNKLKKK